jgi:four helix bundle protein
MAQEGHNKPPQNIQIRTFNFACRIVRLHQYLYKCGGTQRDIGRQVLQSGTSIGANLEEADAGQSRADFISKCGIALKEAREAHFWLRVMSETGLVSTKRLASLIAEASEIVAILTAIVKTLGITRIEH